MAETHVMERDTIGLPDARQIARRVAALLALVTAGVLLVAMLPGLEEMPRHLAGADPAWVAIAVALQLASVGSFSLAFHGAFDRRTSPRTSASVSMAIQGMNIVLPAGGTGGMAVGAVILDRAGVPRSVAASRTVALFLLTSAVSFAGVIVAGFGVALGLLGGDAALLLTLVPATGALLLVLAVAALPRAVPATQTAPERRVRRAVWNARVHLSAGIADSVALVRSRDWLVIGGSIGYYAFDVAALAASFHALGLNGLPVGLLVLAYTLGHGGAIIPLPGSAEGGLIGMLVLYGAAIAPATAAVLAYRAVHAGVPMLLGVAAIADVRRLVSARGGRVQNATAARFSASSAAIL